MSRRTLINLVFFNLVFLLMVFWAINNIVTVDRVERPYTITGDFAQAAGVKASAEVTYLGVHYGRVSGVERIPGGVSVTMKIDRDRHIPAGSIARVFRKSAIGEPYIDFVPPDSYTKGSDARIEPGDNVPLERTTVPLEFSELLRSASALVSSIDPEAAGGLVHELAAALDGRGESLRTMTRSIDQLTSTFVERTEQLDRLTENNTRITSVLADHRLSLGRSIENLRAVAETLREADGDTQVLLDIGPDFLGITADLVAEQKQNLDCLLTDLAPILRTVSTPERVEDLAAFLQHGPLGFGYTAVATDAEADGLWVRVNLLVGAEGTPPEVYVPKRSLPVVPAVPVCASPLTATPVAPTSTAAPAPASPRPAAPIASSPPVPRPTGTDLLVGPADLADTGGEPLLVLGLVLTAGALATWQARRGGRTLPETQTGPR